MYASISMKHWGGGPTHPTHLSIRLWVIFGKTTQVIIIGGKKGSLFLVCDNLGIDCQENIHELHRISGRI